jgi:hypothetical protein
LERADLQRLLRARISAIADGVLIVSAEFGAFTDAYKMGDRLLLDVQQVIPLPEASELTIQLRRRGTQARAARTGDGPDWTPHVITTPAGQTVQVSGVRERPMT